MLIGWLFFFHVKHPSLLEIPNDLGMYLILEARPTERLFRCGCTLIPWLKKCGSPAFTSEGMSAHSSLGDSKSSESTSCSLSEEVAPEVVGGSSKIEFKADLTR